MPVSVRYIVNDADAAITFYTKTLGFSVDMHPAQGFARPSRGKLHLLLNRPGASGPASPCPRDSRVSGGWNRIQTEVNKRWSSG